MLSPYTIIIVLFVAAGLVTMVWGWTIIRRSRKTRSWPSVAGAIVESLPYSKHDAHMPHITYQYIINGRAILNTLTIPAGVTPSEEFAKSYVKKFPAGAQVQVYYDPENPEKTTLEPGLASGDWLVFALGVGASLLGISLLLLTDY